MQFFSLAVGSGSSMSLHRYIAKQNSYPSVYEKRIFALQCKDRGAFAVVVDSYVKEEEGTGVVHQAPYFGAVSMSY